MSGAKANYDIYNADCFDVFPYIADKSVDMILTDMPYGTTKAKWDIAPPIDILWCHYRRIIKDNGTILLFSQQPRSAELIMTNRKWFRYEWIWEKSKRLGFLNANKMPLRVHENILVFYKKLPTYNPQFEKCKPYKRKGPASTTLYGNFNKIETTRTYDKKFPTDILRFPNTRGDTSHPTAKPIALCEYLIKTYTNEGETVFDSFMGCGSTGIACMRTNRNFIGIEKDESFYNEAKQRIESEFDNPIIT